MRNYKKEREWRRKKYVEEYKPAYDAWVVHYPFTTESLDGEIWLPIPDYEKYHGSNFGRVKSFHNGEVKILKPTLTRNGYLHVGLWKNNKVKNFYIHVLVAKLFIPNPENKPQVDHVFGMKFDCSVWNLRWTTKPENMQAAFALGLAKSGEESVKAKFTNEQVRYIRQNPNGLTTYKLAEMFKVDQQTISNIQLGTVYKNAGGTLREKKFTPTIITDEKRAQILADYQKGVRGHSYRAVAKKFGVNHSTVWRIVHEAQAAGGSE